MERFDASQELEYKERFLALASISGVEAPKQKTPKQKISKKVKKQNLPNN